ncbi:hypothetical protein [Pelagibacterium sp. H642]|uniref:hypothetical protein n=1 Tax=Pelagibacterium sp. H642 TaxID=1881069 RepID=UPI00281688AD|nr:hypothetical protein [Pelagibacterium sp. H642]WMT92857.1 hypothetical protein NO934_18945 [Pelagibacterium sp. H642]
MSKHLPPVPPENQSKKGPGEHREMSPSSAKGRHSRERNLAEQGRQGNIKQNTTNQGFQQDR